MDRNRGAKWVRVLIGAQIIFAFIVAMASRADRGLGPVSGDSYVFQLLLAVAGIGFFLMVALPVAVLVVAVCSGFGAGRMVWALIATAALAGATLFCYLPLVQ